MQQQRRATAIATSQLRAELSSLRTDVGDAKAAILRPQAHSPSFIFGCVNIFSNCKYVRGAPATFHNQS